MDGYGVLSLFQGYTETKDITFIFLTVKAERLDLRKGLELGADDYLVKPFDDLALLNAIQKKLK